ncbi:MAG: glycosyltransferase [Chloroflexi bacterium]|nr:glycosyltransferase [Chloroflexota bacterium]
MKIELVNIGYPPFLGGSQRYVQEVAQRLAADGHQVTVHVTDAGEVEAIWNSRKRRLQPGVERDGAVTVIRYPIEHLRPSPWAYYAVRRVMPMLTNGPPFPKRC